MGVGVIVVTVVKKLTIQKRIVCMKEPFLSKKKCKGMVFFGPQNGHVHPLTPPWPAAPPKGNSRQLCPFSWFGRAHPHEVQTFQFILDMFFLIGFFPWATIVRFVGHSGVTGGVAPLNVGLLQTFGVSADDFFLVLSFLACSKKKRFQQRTLGWCGKKWKWYDTLGSPHPRL